MLGWANDERTSTLGWTIPVWQGWTGDEKKLTDEMEWNTASLRHILSFLWWCHWCPSLPVSTDIYQPWVSMPNADQMRTFPLIFTRHTKRPPQAHRPFLMRSIFQIHTAHTHNLTNQIDLLSVQVFIPQILYREKQTLSIFRTSKNLYRNKINIYL